MQLVIGNKNYSSWSMRPWLLLTHFGVEFEEIVIPLFVSGYKEELRRYSPSLRVPVLIDSGNTVWDSLSICEYINEKCLDGAAYPRDMAQRSRCRSYCSEMHAGFFEIRNQMPMNCRAQRRLDLDGPILEEIARIDQMWEQALAGAPSDGPYLFGSFSMADCFFAPVVCRFHTYGVKVSNCARSYMDTILQNPAVQRWIDGARAETSVLEAFELGEEISP